MSEDKAKTKWTQAILYARISPKKDESDVTSIDAQLAYEIDYCNRNEYEVAGQFSDVCLSGDDVKRPGLWAAVDAVKAGGVLIIYKLDRLARGVMFTETVRTQLKKQRARFETVFGLGKYDTPHDRLVAHIMASIAEFEREVINARTKYAMKRKQAAGQRMSLHAPFGWMGNPDDEKTWLRCPREQAILEQIKRHRAFGRSLYEICHILTLQGMKPRAGNWNKTKLHRIVKRLDWERPLAPAGQAAETSTEGGQQQP